MDDLIYGRNPVLEALSSPRSLERIFVQGEGDRTNRDIVSRAKTLGVSLEYVDRRALERLCGHDRHQGVAARIAPIAYAEWPDLIAQAKERGESPFLLVCDHLEDPHNLGAILRTALCFGVHGVILPKKRSVQITPAVVKTSAGAALHLKVARVANIAQTLERLKEEGLWIAGTDADGEPLDSHAGLSGPLALVIGSEGQGMSRLVRKRCDFVLRIPMEDTISSLNAS